jgi:hypothetical protein
VINEHNGANLHNRHASASTHVAGPARSGRGNMVGGKCADRLGLGNSLGQSDITGASVGRAVGFARFDILRVRLYTRLLDGHDFIILIRTHVRTGTDTYNNQIILSSPSSLTPFPS